MSEEIDLAQFVSDYVQMCKDNGERRLPKAKDICAAYQEATGRKVGPDKDLLSQVRYYLS